MPEKVSITPEIFAKFHEYITNKGFTPLLKGEFQTDLKRYQLLAPSRIKRQEKGSEVGYRYEANDLVVKVWTTYLPEKGDVRMSDEGWVLIASLEDEALDFTHPLRRTKNFLNRLYKWAQVAKERVDKRPSCPCCNAAMNIGRGVSLKDRIWVCTQFADHPSRRIITLPWDALLSDKALDFVRADSRVESTHKAMLKRGSWKSAPPQEAHPVP